uniref:SET domain-containing protein n=1 Tax=Romanomermis culicivorax TaxID=13658 RepID=A0A915KI84_ROMCU
VAGENFREKYDESRKELKYDRQRRVKKSARYCPSATPSPDAQQQPGVEIDEEFNEGEDDYIDEEYVEDEEEENGAELIPVARHIRFADIPTHIRFDSDDDENDDTQGAANPITPAESSPSTFSSSPSTWPNLVVRQTANVGRGVFAVGKIAKGAVVANYNGNFMKTAHFDKMVAALVDEEEKSRKADYRLDFVFNGVKYSIDASAEDQSIGRLINHCKRHANLKPTAKCFDDGALAVLFVAKREIDVGEQLLFDYGNKYAQNVVNNCPCDERDQQTSGTDLWGRSPMRYAEKIILLFTLVVPLM